MSTRLLAGGVSGSSGDVDFFCCFPLKLPSSGVASVSVPDTGLPWKFAGGQKYV